MKPSSRQQNEPDLIQLLTHYEAALSSLSAESQPSSRQVLRVLRSRNQIQMLIAQLSHLDDEFWEQLADLDLELKQKSDLIHKTQRFEQLRQSLEPPESFWWWYLDPPEKASHAKSNWDRFDWLWNIGTVACLVIATSLMTQTAKAFSTEGFDLLGTLSTISQGAGLVFVAGGALTDKGKQVVSKVLRSFSVPPSFHAEVTFGASVLLLVVALGINQNLNVVGDWYFKKAQYHEQNGEFSQAFETYRRSLNFSPDDYKTQISIGFLYERLGNFDQAVEEYKKGSAFGIPEFLNAQARAMLMGALQQNDWQGGIEPDLIREAQELLKRAESSIVDYSRAANNFILNPRLRADIKINQAIAEMASIEFEEQPSEPTRETLSRVVSKLRSIKDFAQEEAPNTLNPVTTASTLGEVRENCFYQKAFSIGWFLDSPITYGRDLLLHIGNENTACFPFRFEQRLSTTPDSFFLLNYDFFDLPFLLGEKSKFKGIANSELFIYELIDDEDGNRVTLIQEPDIWLHLAQELSREIQENFVAEDNSDTEDERQIIWRLLLNKDGRAIAYFAYDDVSRAAGDNLSFTNQVLQKQSLEKLNSEFSAGGNLEFADFKVVLSQNGELLHILPWQMAYTTYIHRCKEQCQSLFLHPRVRSVFQSYTPDLNDPAELAALEFVLTASTFLLGIDTGEGVHYKEPAIFKLKVSADGQIVTYQAENQVAIEKFGQDFPLIDLESAQFPELQKVPYTDFKLEYRGLAYELTPWSASE